MTVDLTMKNLLLPLLAALALPTSVNADSVYKVKDACAKWDWELTSLQVAKRLGLNPKSVKVGDSLEQKARKRVKSYCSKFDKFYYGS